MGEKLNYKRTFFIGLAFLSICAFWQMYDNIIPLILQNTFHMGETLTGAVMAMDNVLALFLLPLFGTLSDKVDTPLGKRTPFILCGTALAVLFMMLLPAADRGVNLPLFLGMLFCALLAMGFYRSPAVALMPDLTPNSLRSRANAVINLMGAVGSVYALIMIKLLVGEGERPSYLPLFVSIASLMVLAVGVLVLTVPEKKLRRQMEESAQVAPQAPSGEEDSAPAAGKTSLPRGTARSMAFMLASIFLWFLAYNAVTTAFSRYTRVVWGMEGGSFAIFAGSYHPLINVAFALIGVAWAAINVNSYPMIVAMGQGADIGKFTGTYYTFSMAAQIITPILSGFLMERFSYRTLFPYALVCSLLAFVTMTQVRHGDVKPGKKASLLENFDLVD